MGKFFDVKFFFTPVAIAHTKRIVSSTLSEREYIGFATVYIFGFRVAHIQQTKPWQS